MGAGKSIGSDWWKLLTSGAGLTLAAAAAVSTGGLGWVAVVGPAIKTFKAERALAKDVRAWWQDRHRQGSGGTTGVQGRNNPADQPGWVPSPGPPRASPPPPCFSPPVVTVETEPAPQVFTTQTRVATVEVDQVSEAVSYAFSQALRKHEASVATGVIESIRSMANQYLSSKGHQARI